MRKSDSIKRTIIFMLILVLGIIMITGCGSPEKKLIGTWHYIDEDSGEVSDDKYIAF